MTTVPRGDEQADLSRFGYAQELFRAMGGFSNFAISFSIISVLTGAVTLYGYGLEMGGPLEMSLGWPIATFFTLLLAASMAELCSAWPTSGAMYHWASGLGSPGLGWLAACLNIIGGVAAQAGINYSCAQFALPFLSLPATQLNLWLMFAFISINQAALNHWGVRLVAILNDLSVTAHILGVVAIVAAVFWLAPVQPASFLATAVNSNGRSPYWWAFLLGLLQAHWTFTGFDGSAHMAEETEDPRRRAPWGIVLSVAVSGAVGYLLLLGLTLAIRDLPSALNAKDASGASVPAAIAVLQTAISPRAGAALGMLTSIAMWFCGLSSLASSSRTLFSLARDGGTPAWAWLRRVSKVHGTPGPAIWSIAATSLVVMFWTEAIPVVTSLSTVTLYIAYVIPVILGIRNRAWVAEAPWNLGRYGTLVNAVAIVYTIFICVVLVMPPNELAGKTIGGVLLILLLLWFGWVRRRFQGPEWSHSK